MEGSRPSTEADRKLESGTATSPADDNDGGLHPALYIALWISLNSSVILFNKWVLASAKFNFPMFLTTWHMVFSTAMTQIMACCTTVLYWRHKVPMNAETYRRAIFPIGILLSLSLICGNLSYLYLSVSFIQMLKATNSVATLLTTWLFRIAPLKALANVSVIFLGKCGW
ncbi:triose-phosphate transporter family-domain-containing protein [Apiospora arundinis]